MNNKLQTICFTLLIALSACKKNTDQPAGGGGNTPADKIAPDGFNFNTTKQLVVNIQLLAPNEQAIKGVPVTIYGSTAIQANGKPAPSSALFTAITDRGGYIKAIVTVPASVDTVLVDPNYAGLLSNVKAYISGNNLSVTIGGKSVLSGNVINGFTASGSRHIAPSTSFGAAEDYKFMGTYNDWGRPDYLEKPDLTAETITPEFLKLLNSSFTPGVPVLKTHPEYLKDNTIDVINVKDKTDLFISFLYNKTENNNMFGYYTYPTGKAPADPSEISDVKIIFPNASFKYSNGDMEFGDKVNLGTFDAGTSVGFILIQDGWNAFKKGYLEKAQAYYSDAQLNPGQGVEQKHTVVLYDDATKGFLVGFQDEDSPIEERSFATNVFFVTAGAPGDISSQDVPPTTKATDSDGDGVDDEFDNYPLNPSLAYDSYYPSQESYSTIAFEDNWPKTGDYDLNDLVVGSQYHFLLNASNQVAEMQAKYVVQAAGASFKNGFGVQLPVPADMVKFVKGQRLKNGYIELAGNGVEAGQKQAVLIPFDSYDNVIDNYAGAYFVNTKLEMPKVTGDTVDVQLGLTQPVGLEKFNVALFNPFLISDKRRGYEVHLPGYQPTDKADVKLFRTDDDVTNLAKGITYVSNSNWPWAISFPGTFLYPVEGAKVSDAYPHFLEWAKSGGVIYNDWFSNYSAEYMNYGKIYKK